MVIPWYFFPWDIKQCGSGLPVFVGAKGQRGHGILSGLFRSAVPFLKHGLKFLGRQAIKTGARLPMTWSREKILQTRHVNVLAIVSIRLFRGSFHRQVVATATLWI